MTKINQEEYEMLKGLDDKWKWIARDEDRGLYVFTKKPVRKDGYSSYWRVAELEDPYTALGLFDEIHLFQFIQWEDDEPYNISELIEEYESEETEVKKDIEWLKKELDLIEDEAEKLLDKYIDRGPTVDKFEERLHSVNIFRHLLNQLDEPEVTLDKAFEKVAESYSMTKEETWRHLERFEAHGGKVAYGEPEVLSDKWIDEHAKAVTYDGMPDQTEVVYVDDLENLLVPKQEEITHKQVEKYLLDKNIRVIDIDIYEEMQSELEELKNGVTLSKTETVADVIADFYKSLERFKEVLGTKVEEVEE